MKKHFLILTLILLAFASPAYAANTQGYAWSESVGWFDFSNTTITDTTVTGHAYNDNTGWVVLDGITNSNGTLSGYAWSESLGYIDFSDVYIENNTLKGYAYNDNTGWINFTDTQVTTTWTPATPTTRSYGSSSSRSQKKRVVTPPPSIQPTTPPLTPTVLTYTPSTPLELKNTLSSNPRDLEQNTQGEDVKLLQQFLNSQGFTINTPGLPGSQGYETTYFGTLTRQALIKFQQAHNIQPSLGYFGPKTRAFIQSLTTNN